MVKKLGWVVGSIFAIAWVASCGGPKELPPPKPVPAAYQDKHMPDGWWTDPKIIAEGKEIYEGRYDVDVNCASCHGKTGKPKKRGARDFRVADRMKLYSDSYIFWRVSEGVKRTKMKAWKKKLGEEDRWKAIAYIHQWSHEGAPAAHDDYTPPAPKETETPAAPVGMETPAAPGGMETPAAPKGTEG